MPGPVAGLGMSVALTPVNVSMPHTLEASHCLWAYTLHTRERQTRLSDCVGPTSVVCKSNCEDTLEREVRWGMVTPSNYVEFVTEGHSLKPVKLYLRRNCGFQSKTKNMI